MDDDQGQQANYIVEYEDGECPHYLHLDEYSCRMDARVGSWYVISGEE